MLIIPEIETVVILPPRTGSGSLYRTVLEAYPKSFMPYRHMEADGIPFGYDRWRRIGVLRHPVSRMWSLYNYLRSFGLDHDHRGHWDNYYKSRRDSADMPFEKWLLTNQVPFSNQFDDHGVIRPQYMVLHSLPENRKSQFFYIRPDLGTEIVPYTSNGSAISETLGIDVGHIANVTGAGANRNHPLTEPVFEHLQRFHNWDLEACMDRGIPIA